MSTVSRSGSFSVGGVQSTGQTSTHSPDLTPTQGSAITKVMCSTPRLPWGRSSWVKRGPTRGRRFPVGGEGTSGEINVMEGGATRAAGRVGQGAGGANRALRCSEGRDRRAGGAGGFDQPSLRGSAV